MKSYLEELNPEQKKVVETTDGPILVLAGAGSGKTRVLTYRIAFLIQKKKILPEAILAMTFTKKAAGEMKERISSLVGENQKIWIGTFHSTFAKILRRESTVLGYSPDFVIYDTDDQGRLVKYIMEELHFSIKQYSPQSVLESISRSKNSLVMPEEFKFSIRNRFEELVSTVYPVYQNRLKMNNAMDFDDLITLPIILFADHPQILHNYQNRFQYLLVDEYQDTNRAQYRLIQCLTKLHRNLCVVGDDDQSIYRWRGADIRNILDFEKDFPDSKIFRLEQNYRSTQNILNAASSVVRNNLGRKGKTLWTNSELGEKIQFEEAEDEHDEAVKVVSRIREEVFRKKRTFRDFAALYRTNAQSRALEDGLRKSRISYLIVGGVRFYERKEIKNILAYFKLIVNPKDSISLKRVINFPLRGIGETSVEKLEKWAENNKIDIFSAMVDVEKLSEIPLRIRKNITQFHDLIKTYADLKNKISLNELVHTLVDEVGLLSIYKGDTSVEGQGRAENIKELLAAITEYAEASETPSLSGFLEEMALISDIDSWNDKSNAVTLMTLHSAKGLEFPVVFITGLEEGLFPNFRSFDDIENLEEERRLFYVGLTRAKEKIYLLRAKRRNLYNGCDYRLPSRFLNELEPSVVETISDGFEKDYRRSSFRRQDENQISIESSMGDESRMNDDVIEKGVWVTHELFGKGQVVDIEGKGEKQKVSVHFEGGFKKKFLMKYAKFNIL